MRQPKKSGSILLRVTPDVKARLEKVAKGAGTNTAALCRNIIDLHLGLSENDLKRMHKAIEDTNSLLAKMQRIVDEQGAKYQALRKEYITLRAKQTAVEVVKARSEVSVS